MKAEIYLKASIGQQTDFIEKQNYVAVEPTFGRQSGKIVSSRYFEPRSITISLSAASRESHFADLYCSLLILLFPILAILHGPIQRINATCKSPVSASGGPIFTMPRNDSFFQVKAKSRYLTAGKPTSNNFCKIGIGLFSA